MWKYAPSFWARSAGLPVSALELASPKAVTACAEVVRLEGVAAARDAELHAELAAIEDKATRRRALRRLRRGGDPRQRGLRDEIAAARSVARETIVAARTQERLVLRRFIADPRVLAAAALTSRGLAAGLRRAAGAEHGAEIERRALLFAQRLTAKPAMMAEFGPCFWGAIDPVLPDAARVDIGDALVRERRVFFEHWAVLALARRIGRDLATHCIVRLNPGCLLDGTTLYYPINHRLRLEPLEAEVVRWCTEGRTKAELDARIAAHPERDQVATLFANHLKSGVATCEIEIPTVEHAPEERLRAFLATIHTPWRATVDELVALRDARRFAELDQRFEAVTGLPPSRNPGAMHGARFVTYEDASRDVEVTFGAPVARDLDALAPVFDLASTIVRECAARYEHKLVAAHARLARSLSAIDFVTFTRETQWIESSAEVLNGLVADLRETWATHLGARLDAPAIELAADDFRAVASAFASRVDPLPAARCHAACVHLVGAPGDHRLVLDKLYKGVPMLVHPAALPFAPDGVLSAFRGWLREPLVQLVDLPGSYHRSNLNLPDVPELSEVALPGGPSRFPATRTVRSSELEVVEHEGRLRVRSHDGSVDTPLFALRWPFLQRKLLEVSILPHRDATRVTMGRWILARAAWKLAAETLAWRDEPLLDVTRWKRAHGVPDHVFVKAPAQPKSVALDLRSALHADLLKKLVAQAAANHDTIRVTEMLPDPSQCWLSDRDGARYVCELRFTTFEES